MEEKLANRLILIEYNLKIMKDYLQRFKQYLDSIRDETLQKFYEQRKPNDHFVNVSLEIEYMGIFDVNMLRLPQLHYSSFLVTWYSFIESELKELCEFCKEEYKLSKTTTSLKGLYHFKKYINNEVGISVDQDKWEELDCIRRLRNKIAHLGPEFDRKLAEYQEKNLKKYIDTHELLREGKYKSIHIHYNFCIYLLEFASKFFNGIYNDISLFNSQGENEK